MDVLVGSATSYETRDLITNESCNKCHRMVWMHGDQRTNVEDCVLCHTRGAEDRNSSFWKADPTAAWNDSTVAQADDPTPGRALDFREMIHAIHNGANLTQDYTILGYPAGPGVVSMCTVPGGPPPPGGPATCQYAPHNFNHIVYPRFDGHTGNCGSCHSTDAWQEVPTEHAARVCLSCHDSDSAASHAALNTDPVYGESCGVCHGPGRQAALVDVHDDHIHYHID
jgi:OmcA/MtrC family decaheme c-type cytochrome